MNVSERIASLAPEKRALLEQMLQQKRGNFATPRPLVKRQPGDRTPVSFAQQRLWFLDQLEPGAYAFNMPVAVVFEGALNLTALEKTFCEVIRRHESLRTTIAVVNNEPVQVIAEAEPITIAVKDLTHLPKSEREPEAKRLANIEAQTPFDLSVGPLLRVSLLKLDEEEHVLLLTLHHIISDGWSMGVLIGEVAQIYGAFRDGRIPQLAELPLQYADYAAWQRGWLQGEVLEGELAYWRKQLAQAPAMLELPIDKPRQATQSFNGEGARLMFSRGLSEALKDLSKENGATLFMTLLTAYQVLLHRYTGAENIVVGTPIAGRNRPEIEGIIGFFLNSLALNADLTGEPTFRETLLRVREVTLGAYAHQNLPIEKIIEELQPERSTGRRPIFEVFFNMLNFASGGVELPGLKARYLCEADIGSKFDLTLYAEDQPDGLSLLLAYNCDLFSRERMTEMLRQYEYLLQQVVANPGAKIESFNLVTREARPLLPDPAAKLSDKWEGSVPEKFSAHARRSPHNIAVVDKDETWTYSELETRSNQLANYLIANGIGPGDCVAIYAHRSASLVWALLGIFKAGAAFVVLDPAHPVLRQIDFLEISGARAFLQIEAAGPVSDELRQFLGDLPCLVIPSLTDAKRADFLAGHSVEIVEPAIGPDSLAYIAFTSGTTDKPKGIRGRHGSLTHFVPWQTEQFGFNDRDRTSMLSGISHDPLHRDVFIPLQTGSCICIPDPDMVSEPGWLASWMKDQRVTIANLTPAMGRVLCESDESLPDLRQAFYVGEALTRKDVASFRRLAPTVNCVNYYGTTETQRAVSYFVVPEDGPATEIVPLGRGIKDVQLLVVNKAGRLAGVGEVGEIYFRSPHFALGYVGDTAFTNERFVVNPFTGDEHDRLYRTGDLGRYMPDGNVEPLGRADFQVKIRGFRVELAECESVLGQHENIAETVVVARQDGDDSEKRLVAYVVLKPQKSWDPVDLRSFLARRLPDYMVPAAFVQLDAIPLTQNSKVNRAALPAPDNSFEPSVSLPPETPTEEMLAGIWAQLLRVESVGVEDNFFELGGHSLLATQVVSRAREMFKTEVPLRALFEAPTVRAMARRIDEAQSERGENCPGPIERAARDRDLPLSFAQQRLWFLDQLEPENAAYNMGAAVRLVGHLNVPALERSLTAIVRRHETLRTTFAMADDQPVQLISESVPVTLSLHDLSLLPRSYREAIAKRMAHEETSRPFNLAVGPLWRASLVKLAAEEHVFVFSLHHIISDGWSMGVLVNEVAALYQAFVSGEESPLAELPVQYADYASWQRSWLSGERLDQQLGYWKEKLSGAPALLELPTDRPRPAVQTFNGGVTSTIVPEAATAELKRFSQREGATLFMTLLAAFQTLLHRYSRQDDIIVGTPIANRTQIETESLIGCFVNTLALRSTFDDRITFTELLQQVRETMLGAYQHQELPFERIVEELQPERSLSHSPLFQVMFGMLDGTMSDAQLPGLVMSPMDAGRSSVRFDLVLNAADTGVGLGLTLEYNTDLFDEATANRMLSHLMHLLEQVVVSAAQPIDDLALMRRVEERRLIADYNDTHVDHPPASIIQLFEQQVAETPDALAVIFGAQQTTYAELNARSNQLARHLQEMGIEHGALVGLLLERSTDLVVALLGILKAGAAYLPLDPYFPAERLALTVTDAKLKYLITNSTLTDLVPHETMTVLSLDEASAIADKSTDNLEGTVPADSLAYVIYTSGSTGRPKGIAITHRSVTNFLRSMQREPGLTAEDRVLAITTLSFDIAVLELLLPLTTGAATMILSRDESADAVLLSKAIERDVTVMQATPATWRMLIDAGWDGRPALKALVGGEALSPSLMHELLPRVGELWNMYGPTETTVWSTLWKVPSDTARISIGKPLANTQVYVLDSKLRPVPPGVAGELFIGGQGLALGYWKQPALTAERFLPDPFGGTKGGRLYRTGDVVIRRAAGELEYAGRADAQVKIRGFRIELGDVETALMSHPSVVQSVVIAREWGKHAGLRLAAYIVSAEGSNTTSAELRTYLRTLLPDYMIPSGFVFLAQLPLTPNGKIDRKLLPEPEAVNDQSPTVSDATQFEELLAEIWRELLAAENISAHSNFFELGGHSLLATQVIARVREMFNVELSLRTLFENPTIRQLADRIHASANGDDGLQIPPITRASREQDLPLSFAQQRLWFLDQLAPGRSGYNIFAAVRLMGELNVNALQRTLTEIVSRHETLRTSMPAVNGEPVQLIESPYEVALPVTDLSEWTDAEDRERESRRLAQDEAERPFDLVKGRLFRTSLIKVANDEHVMLLTLHHIISDAWSLGVLVREVVALYPTLSDGRPAMLPELPIQYADYASWQRNWLTGDVLERQLSFWQQQLEGAPLLLDLPTDYPRPPVQSFRGASRLRVLSPELSASVRSMSRREGTTLFMTLLAAFQTLLHRFSGVEDILVSTGIANRTRAETEKLIGFFVNTIIIRADFSDGPSFRELLRQVREATLAAHAHQDLPFEKLVEVLQPVRDPSYLPLSQVMFVLQNLVEEQSELTGLMVEPFASEVVSTKFDLIMWVEETDERLAVSLQYATDLFAPATIDQLLGYFEALLQGVVNSPEQEVGSLTLQDLQDEQDLQDDEDLQAISC